MNEDAIVVSWQQTHLEIRIEADNVLAADLPIWLARWANLDSAKKKLLNLAKHIGWFLGFVA